MLYQAMAIAQEGAAYYKKNRFQDQQHVVKEHEKRNGFNLKCLLHSASEATITQLDGKPDEAHMQEAAHKTWQLLEHQSRLHLLCRTGVMQLDWMCVIVTLH